MLVTGAVVSGCGGSPATGRAAEISTLPNTACDAAVLTGDINVSLVAGGIRRSIIVHVPTGYTDRSPAPLILNLHGSGSTAAEQEAFSAMDSASNADGFVVAYPQGAIISGSGYDWNVPGQPLFGGASPPPNAPDDVAFLLESIHTLAARLCIDPTRVYATGFSGGARMTSQLGCDLSNTIAAIAPVSGLRLPSPCAGRPVPVISFHGAADPIDPYGGDGQAYWTYSVSAAAQRWAAHDECRTSPRIAVAAPDATLTDYVGCVEGSAVELYTLADEGHEWPGGPRLPARLTRLLGPQSSAINADTTMWQFFQAHPLSVTATSSSTHASLPDGMNH